MITSKASHFVIGIDGNEANVKNRVGVNKYAFEIIKGIAQLLPKNPLLIVYVYLKQPPLDDMPKETKNFRYKILAGGKVWIVTKLVPHLRKNSDKVDVFFTPSHYLPPLVRLPMVCSIMDLGYLEFSAQFKKYDYWQLKLWSAYSIKVSKYILTISEATMHDIVRRYPSSRDKVVITYPGYDKYLTTTKVFDTSILKVKEKYSIVNDYILYLGTLKPSKNIEGLIKAFSKLDKKKNLKLVIAGKKGWLYESVFELVKRLGLEEEIVFTDFIDEADKVPLIKASKAFVLPSFWEGFGIDVLTAFALEVPVVASKVGSLPEVVGDAGVLVDPFDVDSIAKGINKVLEMDKKDYNNLVSKGKIQLKKFSWEKSAEKTLEILGKAAHLKAI